MYSFLRGAAAAAATFAVLSSAVPLSKRQSGSSYNVLYWGADNINAYNTDLSHYCDGSTANVINLGFVNQFGHDPNLQATFGPSCKVQGGAVASGADCTTLGSQIQKCQKNGVKIFISIGGWGADAPTSDGGYTLTSQDQGNDLGKQLYNLFAGSSSVFGSGVKVDGFDFDIEGIPNGATGDKYYQYTVNTLRQADSSLLMSASPQCASDFDENIGDSLQAVKFDIVNVQFYNNPNSAQSEISGGSSMLFDQIYQNLGASKAGIMTIGLPAEGAAVGPPTFTISPADAAKLYNKYKSHPGFGGFMTYSAGYSDADTSGGCTYAQNLFSILKTGSPCGGSTQEQTSQTPQSPGENTGNSLNDGTGAAAMQQATKVSTGTTGSDGSGASVS